MRKQSENIYPQKVKVALVCRFPNNSKRWYTYQLAQALKNKAIDVKLYGPKTEKSVNVYYECVWRWWSYPLDIVYKAIRDNVKIVHIQFEFPTFKIIGSLLLPSSILLLRLLGIKCIVTLHGPIIPLGKEGCEMIRHLLPKNYKWIPCRLAIFILRILYISLDKLSNKIIVHANIFRELLYAQGLRKINVVHHGINFPDGISSTCNVKAKSIVYFGTISPRKGIEFFLEAVSKISDYLRNNGFNVIIVGYVPDYYKDYAKSIEKLVQNLNIQDLVALIYNLSDEEVDTVLKKAKLAVLPYTFSISGSGAFATIVEHGIPVLISGTPYFEEKLGSEYIGMFEIGNSDELERKLLIFLSDNNMRQKLKNQLLSKLKLYNWEQVSIATIKIYLNSLLT